MTVDPHRLRERLLAADYTFDAVAAALTDAGQAGLGRNQTLPAERALAGRDDAVATLTRLFILQRAEPADRVRAALGDVPDLVAVDGDLARARVDVRPYGSPDDGATGWLVADLTPGLDGARDRPRPDFVLGASPASRTLAEITPREAVGAALDLGTGCGVQSLHLARHAGRLTATDLLPRAVELARLTLALNDVDAEVREGSLYKPVTGERFDLIVSNPPYVMAPPAPAGERLVYREGAFSGDDLVRRVVVDGAAHLNPGGTLQVLANWAVPRGGGWEERLAGWVAQTGCDALIVERERLDPYAYVEMWLADAGLLGVPDYRERYLAWLDYLDGVGVAAIGMGWLCLRNAGRVDPDVRIESWPHAVAQPVGAAFAAHFAATDLARAPDAALLATRLRVGDAVDQEAIGRPGAEDPEHLVLRSRTGFRRARRVDTALAGVVGACDGDLPLGAIIAAVAALTGEPEPGLVARLLPEVRELVAEGMLGPG